jgi:CRP/FNR family transcriptional regulator, cyclic AMP receptor protein
MADDEGGGVEALRDCVALMLAQGEVRPVRSLPAAALLAVEDGFVAVRRTAPPARRSVIVDEAAGGGVLLPPAEDEELLGLVPSRVRIISSPALDLLLSGSEGAHAIWDGLASALRRREELIASLSHSRHVDRVREKLLRLARDYGKVDGRGVRIDLPLTHELLAEMVCSARETVTRAVDELEREGFVIREAGGYRLAVDAQLLV